MSASSDITLRHDLRPGDLGMVVHLHGLVYAREYGLDTTFEPYVAKPLADFVLAGPDAGRLWLAETGGGRIVGSAAILMHDEAAAQLRWFLVTPEARGTGLGRRLLNVALDHARMRGATRVSLWTFTDLAAAIHLYEDSGFSEQERTEHDIWGATRTEIRMELIF